MSSVIIAVDLAKHVFGLAVSTSAGRVTERKRLSRSQFERFWSDRPPCQVVMEACGSSHYWGRRLRALGFEVVLLPPHYVRPYIRRNKTDRTDCEALLEALRCAGIHPVAIKSEDQQAIAALHRMRSQWMATRTARINALRGLLGEFGLARPTWANRFIRELPQLLEEKKELLPVRVRRLALATYEEVRSLEDRWCTREEDIQRSWEKHSGMHRWTSGATRTVERGVHREWQEHRSPPHHGASTPFFPALRLTQRSNFSFAAF